MTPATISFILFRSPFTSEIIFHEYPYTAATRERFLSHLESYGRLTLWDRTVRKSVVVKAQNLAHVHFSMIANYPVYQQFRTALQVLSQIYPRNKPLHELNFSDYPELFI